MAGSVLVVDDDLPFRSLVAEILKSIGVDVVGTAASAAGAIVAANALKPDAALVDVGLPDRDGVDLGLELAALPWRPRVVLTSADRNAADVRGARRRLPFVPKAELPTAPLRRMLTGD